METADLRASKNIQYRAESAGKHYKSPQKIWFKRFGTKRPCVQVTSLRPPVNPHEHCVCAGSFHALKRCLNCVLVFIWSLPLRKHTKRYLQKRERVACVHLSHTRSRISVRGRNRLPSLYPGNLFDTGIAGRLPEVMGGW